jgi:hypothetical protein
MHFQVLLIYNQMIFKLVQIILLDDYIFFLISIEFGTKLTE